jgi:hypothetical protein
MREFLRFFMNFAFLYARYVKKIIYTRYVALRKEDARE